MATAWSRSKIALAPGLLCGYKSTMTHRLLLLVLVAGSVACGNVRVNRATLIASTAALVCDWGQTRGAASGGWRTGIEVNPIMGPTPTVRSVDTYFMGAIMINAGLWLLTPERWRSAVPIAVTGVQVHTIAGNVSRGTTGLCH